MPQGTQGRAVKFSQSLKSDEMIKRERVLEDSFGRIGQLIMLNNVVGDAAQTRQFSGLVADAAVIFTKTDIPHVMQSILDAPVPSNGPGQHRRWQKCGADIKSRFFAGLPNTARPASTGVPGNPDQAGNQRRPFRRPPRFRWLKNLDMPFFNPAMPFVGFGLRVLHRVMLNNQPTGFQETGLVVFDLNQQMAVMRQGCFQGFFDSAKHRR